MEFKGLEPETGTKKEKSGFLTALWSFLLVFKPVKVTNFLFLIFLN